MLGYGPESTTPLADAFLDSHVIIDPDHGIDKELTFNTVEGRFVRIRQPAEDKSCTHGSPKYCFTDKDPDAFLDYVIDWNEWLPTDDIIIGSKWLVSRDSPKDITFSMSYHTNTQTKIWIAGGTPKKLYEVVNRVYTQDGRIEDRTILLKCEEL